MTVEKSNLIKFDQVWYILDGSDPKNKTAIFILFKNVTTLYTIIFWYMLPLESVFLQKDRQIERQTDGNTHRQRSSNSNLDVTDRPDMARNFRFTLLWENECSKTIINDLYCASVWFSTFDYSNKMQILNWFLMLNIYIYRPACAYIRPAGSIPRYI